MQKAGKRLRYVKFPVLISRWVSFLFLMCLLVIFLYAAGSIQGFMDSTQLFLLKLGSFLGFFLSLSAFSGFAHGVFLILRERNRGKRAGKISQAGSVLRNKRKHYSRYLKRIVFHMVLAVFGFLSALAALFIVAVSGGNIV